MSRYPILDICARVEGHAYQHRLLTDHCRAFTKWQDLLTVAEREGMAPLLRKHLAEAGVACPVGVRRSLDILYKRHQHQAGIRHLVLQEILDIFARNGLKPIVIKGAALCYTLYEDSALRPMRDIDLLFARSEVDHAQDLMRKAGFSQAHVPIPRDHHHLPSLHKKIDDMDLCVELHRDLYPDCQPYYPRIDFEKLLSSGRTIAIGDLKAVTFNNDETLHYLYQHGFRAPLTYESYKLINAADMIGFIEKYYREPDLWRIKNQFPLLHKALPYLHHISPWNANKAPAELVPSKYEQRKEPTPFSGWPHKRMKELKAEGKKLYEILLFTFIPSKWWLGIYYGVTTIASYLWCLLWTHPRHVLWWVRLYYKLHKDNSSS